MTRCIAIIVALLSVAACSSSGGNASDAGGDTDSDADTDADADAGADAGESADCVEEDPFDPAACPAIGADDLRIRYVDVDAAEGGDGLTWGTAFNSVQPGIDSARCIVLSIGGAAQVWVAEGTYTIFEKCLNDTVRLREGVELYGGFGGDEMALEERDWTAHVTALDGHGSPGSTEQVFHVVLGADDALIDGFSITGGNAVVPLIYAPPWFYFEVWNNYGGGMAILGTSPTVRHCDIFGNAANYYGGASYVSGGAPRFEETTFSGHNQAALFGEQGASIALSDCAFSENGGGGIVLSESTFDIEGCAFTGNGGIGAIVFQSSVNGVVRNSFFWENATASGGAVSSGLGCAVEMEGCVFTGNEASYYGGAVAFGTGSLALTNCTFFDNAAGDGGGAVFVDFGGMVTVANSVFWSNGDEPIGVYEDESSTATVTYSDVQGGYEGAGNIDADPLFADAEGGDFHLTAGSPCIDAADGDAAPELDIDGLSRWDDPDVANTGVGDPDYADMGAYEWQGE